MQHCDHCKVHIAGKRQLCPLCQGVLTGQGDEATESYPIVPFARRTYSMLIRAMVFVSITVLVICFALNFTFFSGRYWSFFVVVGMASMWVSVSSAIIKRHNIPKCIVWQVFWLSLIALLWDGITGWRHWALDYAMPIICVCAMLAMAVLAIGLKLPTEDYMIYLIIDGIFGVVPLLFLTFKWVRVLYPSVICVAVSFISLAALFTFQGEKLMAEIRKRMHL